MSAPEHRWAWDEDALYGEPYAYCENHCNVTWNDGDPEPTEPCPGDERPTPTTRFVVA